MQTEQERRLATEKSRDELEKKLNSAKPKSQPSSPVGTPRGQELAKLQLQLQEEIDLRSKYEQWKVNLDQELKVLQNKLEEENRYK